jgi:glycosyltransferase involved in cell wall biosynthesis
MAQLFSILGMAQETLSSLLRTSVAVGYKFLRSFYGRDRWLLKTADGVFVTSPMQRIILERYYLYPDSRTFTVPYGIEIGDLQPKERAESLRSELSIPQHAKTVVTVTDMSELGEMKNLLQAFQKVTIKKPNTRLIIVGNGPLKHEIEYEMLQLALGSRVIFTGPVKNTDLTDYISLGDVFVDLSSRTSGFEPSMLEAMAQEKVIIGSEVSPISTIVEDGRDGFLIRPADTNALSNLIVDVFTENIMTTEIGSSARKKVLNLFDTEKMVDQTLAAYFKILNRSGYYSRKN